MTRPTLPCVLQYAIHMREIQLQLAKSLVLLFRAFALRHIDVRRDHFNKFSVRGERRLASPRYLTVPSGSTILNSKRLKIF